MRRALLAAALLLAGAATLATAPAAAAATPSGAWTSPAPAATVDDIPVAYLEAPQRLGGWAEFDQGIAGVAFTLVKDAADPTDPCSAATSAAPQSAPGGEGRVDFAFDAGFPCNRRYQVRATVAPAQKPLRRDTPLVLNLWVAVAIPAAPTTGLAAEVGGDRAVSLHWDGAAQAPDFQGYEVRRSVGGAPFARVDEVGPKVTTYTDRAVPAEGGDVRYQVLGMRPGPDAGTTVYADAASPASVTVPAAPGASTGGSGGTARVPTVPGGGAVTPSGGGQQSAHQEFQAPRSRGGSTTPTTADTGYQETLPFKAPEPAGDPAVVARLDGDDDGGQRQTLLLIAGASTAFSWAMVLRFLSRRAVLGF
jgi:hypothetical protein